MSIKLMSAVWDDKSLTSRSELLVMLSIADFSNENGQAWPSIETLAAKSRCSQRSVQDMIAGLQARGKLEVNYTSSPLGTNVYKIISIGEGGVQNLRGGASSRRKSRRNFRRPVAPNPSLSVINHQEPLPFDNSSPDETMSFPENSTSTPPAVEEKEQSPVIVFRELWSMRFKAINNRKYLFLGARDGKAINALLETEQSPAQLVADAEKAWRRHGFICGKASTISGYANFYNDIQVELQKPAMVNGKVDHREQKRLNECAEPGLRAKILNFTQS